MPKVSVLDDYQGVAYRFGRWDLLPPDVEIEVLTEHLGDETMLASRLQDSFAIMCIRERTPFTRTLLERLPNLSLLCNTGMANAAIDLETATALGVVVSGTSSGSGHSTPELTWGLILSLLRSISVEDAATRKGSWQTSIGPELQGKTLGLLGLGRVGSQMAAIGQAFGMNTMAWSANLTKERSAEFGVTLVDLDTLCAQSDILSIHVRLSERTTGLIGSRELGMMKPTAYLINTSRGPIVNETALLNALHQNAIAGAGLDTFDTEPLPQDHPLRSMPNTVVTPHIGYVSVEAYEAFYTETVENILGYLSGKPTRVMNPAVLDGRRFRPMV